MTIPGDGAAPLQVYKISRMTFWGELLKLFLLSIIALVVSLFIAVTATVLSVRMLGIAEGTGVFLILLAGFFIGSLVLGWKLMKGHFQFEIRIYGDHLETSALWFRDRLDADAVETIRDKREINRYQELPAEWVEIAGDGKIWNLHIGDQRPSCLNALRATCRNAIYVDVGGREFLPVSTHQPQRVLLFLARNRRRRAISTLIGGSFLLLFTGFFVVMEILSLTKGKGLELFSLSSLVLLLVTSLVIVFKGFLLQRDAAHAKAELTQLLREAAKAKEALKQYQDQGYHEDVMAVKPVDLSTFNENR